MNGTGYGEKEILTDLLGSQKHIASSYNTSLLESATPDVVSCFKNLLEEEHRIQKTVFDMMHKKGLYPTPAAEEKKISEAKETYGQKVQA